MTIDELTNKLLYVPFNKDYRVNDEIKTRLTEKEFFEKCFQKPDFDNDIQNALNASNEELDDFEIDFEKIDIAEKLQHQKEEASALENWIESKQSDIYCIKGDAGTGKTTYLHYLKYKYRDKNIYWSIVDIQDAIDGIRFLGNEVLIPDFNTLYSKTIASLLLNISNMCFPKDGEGKVNYKFSRDLLETILSKYSNAREGRPPRSEVDDFYKGIIKPNKKKRDDRFCEENAKYFQKYFDDLLNKNESTKLETKFAITLEIYIYFLCCSKSEERFIIALDNFERFIGTYEIFNHQLTEFVSQLRRTQQTIANNNTYLSEKYQLMVLMRNTTLRMIISQQATEFAEHSVDLTEWFDASSVLKNKINWYKENSVELHEEKHLLSILEDMGACGGSLRGLHFKISMLFNYNKRIIIRFLSEILISPVNKHYIDKYDMFWENKFNLPKSISKFAARSIIYRLVLNALRKDSFFSNIIVQKEETQDGDTFFTGSGYARKILTILHEKSLSTNENQYIQLKELVEGLYPHTHAASKTFLDENNIVNLRKVSKVLYYMNYYDGRSSNWLQFIDLQYSQDEKSIVSVHSPQELSDFIKNNFSNIKIRITNAGKAYLFFVVYYFEYFSCKSVGFKIHTDIFRDKDMPPLLCAIPTLEEINKKRIDDLTCVKILTVVSQEALTCISNMDNDKDNTKILFRYKQDDKKLSHKERIINSHVGYIDNFINCIEHLYGKETAVPKEVSALINKITSIRNLYKSN